MRRDEGQVSTGWPVERTATLAAGQADGVLSDINFGEVLPFVAKPLSRDFIIHSLGPILGSQIAGLRLKDPLVKALNPIAFVAGRPYMDLSVYMTLPAITHQLEMLRSADQAKGEAILALARAGQLPPLPLPFRTRLALHLAAARLGIRSLGWLVRLRTPTALLDAYRRTISRLRTMVDRPLEQEAPSVLLAELDRVLDSPEDPTSDGLRHVGMAFFLHGLLHKLCTGRVPASLLDDLGKGIPHNFTTVVSIELWALAQEASPVAAIFDKVPAGDLKTALQATEEGRCWWARFEAFLRQHGHRGEVELDLATPRWREEPTFLLQTVANYLRHPEGSPSPAAVLAEGARRREAAAQQIHAALPFPLCRLFDWLYRRYVRWMPFREAAKYTWLLGFEFARRVYRELGRRLVAEGSLTSVDAVFWLRLEELAAWAESGKATWTPVVLQEREQTWRAWTRLRPPPLLIGTHPVASAPQPAAPSPFPLPPSHPPAPGAPRRAPSRGERDSTVLRGTPASAGVAEGLARVITDPHHAELGPGEILVTRYTDPAWTPLFFTAGALVTEVGGVLSHGAVVAREVGLPAVVGVEGATARISSGQRLRVNATEGTVELL